MKTTENITVYQCDFCKKKLFRKHAMLSHENWCNQNPKNWRACEGCKFIEEIKIDYFIPYLNGDDGCKTLSTSGFKCNKLDKILYSFKAEKKKLPERYPETFENQEPMPNSCKHFTLHDYNW